MLNTYEIRIESKLPQFNRRIMRHYRVDGEDVVGVFGREPYVIAVRNNSARDIEARVTIDGTDIVTGRPGDLDTATQRWLVRAHETMRLEAWPESQKGGAAFVFGEGGSSVTAHTHGDMSHLGIIAAAIFVESAPLDYASMRSPLRSKGMGDGMRGGLESATRGGPGTGAGSYVDQQIQTVKGLRAPRFSEVVHVRYMWWDDLQAKLREQTGAPIPGFPAAKALPFQGVSLGTTPRIETGDPRFE